MRGVCVPVCRYTPKIVSESSHSNIKSLLRRLAASHGAASSSVPSSSKETGDNAGISDGGGKDPGSSGSVPAATSLPLSAPSPSVSAASGSVPRPASPVSDSCRCRRRCRTHRRHRPRSGRRIRGSAAGTRRDSAGRAPRDRRCRRRRRRPLRRRRACGPGLGSAPSRADRGSRRARSCRMRRGRSRRRRRHRRRLRPRRRSSRQIEPHEFRDADPRPRSRSTPRDPPGRGSNGGTGLCFVEDNKVIESGFARTDEDIVERLRSVTSEPCLVAIDAPLVIPNKTGRRECERAISHCFGKHHAGAHSSNLGMSAFANGSRGARLCSQLSLEMDPEITPLVPTRRAIEVYPHPALVALFALPLTLKYKAKRGRSVNQRLAAFEVLCDLLESLRDATPRLQVRNPR